MRRAIAVLASIGLAAGTIALATSAQAQPPTLVIDSNNALSINGQTVQNLTILSTGLTFQNNSGDSVRLQSATLGYLTSANGDCNTSTNCEVLNNQSIALTIPQQSSDDGVSVQRFQNSNWQQVTTFRVQYRAPSPGPAPNSGSTSNTGPAPEFSLTLDSEDGSSCSSSNVAARFGTWVELPAAGDCTAPTSRGSGTLLGWATTPDFPIEIAQRQVDNGWGAYEIFNEDGSLSSVFIPAGGSTLISAPGSLHPIWTS